MSPNKLFTATVKQMRYVPTDCIPELSLNAGLLNSPFVKVRKEKENFTLPLVDLDNVVPCVSAFRMHRNAIQDRNHVSFFFFIQTLQHLLGYLSPFVAGI
jgi:hypothetical protein